MLKTDKTDIIDTVRDQGPLGVITDFKGLLKPQLARSGEFGPAEPATEPVAARDESFSSLVPWRHLTSSLVSSFWAFSEILTDSSKTPFK